MDLRIGDAVLCEDLDRPGHALFGRVVAPLDKHEVRQCRSTKLVVIEFDKGRRRISDGEEVVWRSSTKLVWRTTKEMRQNGMALAFATAFGLA